MRCKSCNNILEPQEIIWIPDRHTHEELCLKCRNSIFEDDEIKIVYPEDIGESYEED